MKTEIKKEQIEKYVKQIVEENSLENINVMKDAIVEWRTEDVVTTLEYGNVLLTNENIKKVATPEFVDRFYNQMLEYGSRLIENRVEEVFGNEKNSKRN